MVCDEKARTHVSYPWQSPICGACQGAFHPGHAIVKQRAIHYDDSRFMLPKALEHWGGRSRSSYEFGAKIR